MHWFGVYVGVATLVTAAVFVTAGWFRPEHIAAPDHSGTMSAIAGMCWPVLLVGITEFALIVWVARAGRHT